MLLETWY